MTRRQFLALILPLLLLLVGFGVVSILESTGAVGAPAWDDGFARSVRRTLGYEFVGGLGGERTEWQAYFNALNGWVQTFDQYAEITPPWELEREREASSGQYVGIGVRTLARPENGPIEAMRITGVKPGGPAAKAGVVVGEEIVRVDGRRLAEISPERNQEKIAAAIRGPKETPVRLEMRDEKGTLRTVKVIRDEVDTGSILGVRMLDEEAGIGYVRIHGFMLNTSESFLDAVKGLMGKGMRALVLDLRYNGGGLLPQAVAVANAFLTSGVIVRVRGRDEIFTETYTADGKGTVGKSVAIAVLVNHGSASASEVLAGALRDHWRAVIVGERSHGKFLVQTVEEIPMDLGTVLFKRTTAIYETPLGLSYQRTRRRDEYDPLAGFDPDLIVPLSDEEHGILRDIFTAEYFADWNPDAEPVHVDFVDRQVEAATAILKGDASYPLLLAGVEESGE
ncbi:MAG: S41 family peptidase [Planctomycetota bacterium]